MAGLDDTDDEAGAVEKHLGKMQERMVAAREETDEVSVVEPEPDDEEDDEPEAVAPTRREKREARMSARERAAAAEARAQVLQEQLESARRPVPGNVPAVANTADVDRRIRATYADLQKLEDEYTAAQRDKRLTPSLEQEMREKAIELDVQKLTLAAERREILTAPTRRQEELTRQLERDNADVYGNQQALRYAAGRVNQLIAMGRQDSKALHDEVMEETRQVILKVKPKPGAIERQRATGMSAGPKAAPTERAQTISMPKGSHYYKQAIALYPDLDPGAACQKWAQKVGKRLLAMKQ
jgi:hypothetical protein